MSTDPFEGGDGCEEQGGQYVGDQEDDLDYIGVAGTGRPLQVQGLQQQFLGRQGDR